VKDPNEPQTLRPRSHRLTDLFQPTIESESVTVCRHGVGGTAVLATYTNKVPTLLLYGDKDVRSPLEVAREMQAEIPGSRLVVMEGVGHEADMEAPDRFNAEVRRFFRSLQS